MTRSTFGLLILALVAVPLCAGAQTDITGTWVVTIDSPLGQANIDTKFTQTGEKVAGAVDGPAGDRVEFSGTLVRNQLSVLYPLPLQGQTLEVRMTGAVEPERMSGLVDLGGIARATWTAKRKPAVPVETPKGPASTDPTSVTGRWNIAIRQGAVSLPMTGTLTQTGESVTGVVRTPAGEVPVTGTMAGTRLTLQFTAQMPQGAVPIALTGELSPQGLAGTSSAVGLGQSEWSATRAE